MQLVLPSLSHQAEALAFRQAFFDAGETTLHGDGGLYAAADYAAWVEKVTRDRTDPLPTFVPATVYFGVAEGRIVGILQIRHFLNEYLLQYGGHIGYSVCPTARRRGHATAMLAQALDACRALGLDRVLLTCDRDNLGSAGTIQKNGGLLENEVAEPDGNLLQRYWITL
ncbi:MAG: GNAT family N-acetyltransferase [Clostridiales bacterium]|nr:GNAT family N-acetyltransferase [Clostridiales bacterium]